MINAKSIKLKFLTNSFLSDACRVAVMLLLIFATFLMAKPALAHEASAEKYFTLDNVNLRSGPGTNFDKLTLVKTGNEIGVTEYDPEGWSKVTFGDLSGYMKSEYIGTYEAYEEILAQRHAVEFTEWSAAKNIFTVGTPAEVYDVYTGITYYVKSFSNGQHADVEPITVSDTELLKKTYGGTWSWDPRPVWVTINGHTMAASINGMPHGGGVNPNNGMNGQVCIHFKGSTTHNGNSSFTRLHQAVAQTAYDLSK